MNKFSTRDKRELYLASLLYDSIEFRHFGSINSLLCEKKADPNVILPKKGISPFHLAIGCDSTEFAEKVTSIILQYGGNPNVRSEDGLTPLHIAAAWGRAQLLHMLLCCGGDPTIRDINYKTPLHYAFEGGFTDCVNLLKNHLQTKNEVTAKGDEDLYSLVLDKIVIDNGQLVKEFNVSNKHPPDSITCKEVKTKNELSLLPKADMTEYIMNWFNKQPNVKSNTSYLEVQETMPNGDFFELCESSFDESDNNYINTKCMKPEHVTFKKMYRKTKQNCRKDTTATEKVPKLNIDKVDNTVYHDAHDETFSSSKQITQCEDYSKESGIVTLPVSEKDFEYLMESERDTTQDISNEKQDKSSDYMTCSRASVNTLERNILDVTDNLSLNGDSALELAKFRRSDVVSTTSNELSFISVVSEVYKYVDKDEGIVLYEKRLLKTPSEYAASLKSTSLSSVSEGLDYDTDTLRKELTLRGYNPGPITLTTKRVYIKKLNQLQRNPLTIEKETNDALKKTYSNELEKTIRNTDWCNDIVAYKSLEEILVKQFANPDVTKKWREGVCKSSFTYLLLDPRVTKNLPCRAEHLKPTEIWETFLSAIFYVGKGKRARPYQHLYEAVELWKKQLAPKNKKIQRIFDIWSQDSGVICLHVFLNIIPVEAYTREAAMISALKIENLSNIKSGEFYGIPATWTLKQKRMLGVYLLYKALMIFLNEGERQLCPMDID